MLIKVKDKKTGTVYSSNMMDNNKHSILEINYCTSYTQVTVQDKIEVDGKQQYNTHDIILPPFGTNPNWVDLIATQEENEGEWVREKLLKRKGGSDTEKED